MGQPQRGGDLHIVGRVEQTGRRQRTIDHRPATQENCPELLQWFGDRMRLKGAGLGLRTPAPGHGTQARFEFGDAPSEKTCSSNFPDWIKVASKATASSVDKPFPSSSPHSRRS